VQLRDLLVFARCSHEEAGRLARKFFQRFGVDVGRTDVETLPFEAFLAEYTRAQVAQLVVKLNDPAFFSEVAFVAFELSSFCPI
jgi:hypothetical protein